MDRTTKLALRLWIILNRAVDSIEDVLEKQVQAHDLSMTEFAVLEALLHKGTLPIGEIGSRVLRSSGSMTYVVDKLERRGLIERQPCAEDRRIIFATLSNKGRALIEKVFPEHAALVRDMMQGLTEDELTNAADHIKKLGLYARDYGVQAEERT